MAGTGIFRLDDGIFSRVKGLLGLKEEIRDNAGMVNVIQPVIEMEKAVSKYRILTKNLDSYSSFTTFISPYGHFRKIHLLAANRISGTDTLSYVALVPLQTTDPLTVHPRIYNNTGAEANIANMLQYPLYLPPDTGITFVFTGLTQVHQVTALVEDFQIEGRQVKVYTNTPED